MTADSVARVTAQLFAGESGTYSPGHGYIIVTVTTRTGAGKTAADSRQRRVWKGNMRENLLLQSLVPGDADALNLDCGPVRVTGSAEEWDAFLAKLVRPPRGALLESPGWRQAPTDGTVSLLEVEVAL